MNALGDLDHVDAVHPGPTEELGQPSLGDRDLQEGPAGRHHDAGVVMAGDLGPEDGGGGEARGRPSQLDDVDERSGHRHPVGDLLRSEALVEDRGDADGPGTVPEIGEPHGGKGVGGVRRASARRAPIGFQFRWLSVDRAPLLVKHIAE
jgi:hypothetical protein